MKTILKISATTDEKEGIRFITSEFECEKRNKSWLIISEGDFYHSFIMKKNFLVANTILKNTHHPISFFTYCFEEDISEARKILIKAISLRINKIINNALKLSSMLVEYNK